MTATPIVPSTKSLQIHPNLCDQEATFRGKVRQATCGTLFSPLQNSNSLTNGPWEKRSQEVEAPSRIKKS